MIGSLKVVNADEGTQEIDVLVRLMPLFNVTLNLKSNESADAKQLRKYLGISRTEADLIFKKKGAGTLTEIIGLYYDKLTLPGNASHVTRDLLPCFLSALQRATEFTNVLSRIIWEYNFANKMFFKHFGILSNLSRSDRVDPKDVPEEVLIFGGKYPMSVKQVSCIVSMVDSNIFIRGLALNFTRIKEAGLKVLCESLRNKTGKAIRINDRRLYSLDLQNNYLEPESFWHLSKLFYDQFSSTSLFAEDAPIPTSIRVLTLDYNFIGQIGCNHIAEILETSRQLLVLSLQKCKIEGRDIHRLCAALGSNRRLKVLNLGSNNLHDQGMEILCDALAVNDCLEYLDLFDVEFGNIGAISLSLALNNSKS